ncbi:hypothetical protein FOA52_013469 [Chlamydomonas sp. UWO 241]|nr:hypothetical protein FOA52_013469 [Chlamydomonas sp. UWO 241]
MSKVSKRGVGELLEPPPVSPLELRLNVFAAGGPPTAAPTPARPDIAPVPKSSLLSRLNAFLPQIQTANADLQEQLKVRPAADFDVEGVPDDQESGYIEMEGKEGGYIEMDLACGLIDLKDGSALSAAESALAGGPDLDAALAAAAGHDGDDSDDSDDATSSDDDSDGDGGYGSGGVGRGNGEEGPGGRGRAAAVADPEDVPMLDAPPAPRQAAAGANAADGKRVPKGKGKAAKRGKPLITEL